MNQEMHDQWKRALREFPSLKFERLRQLNFVVENFQDPLDEPDTPRPIMRALFDSFPWDDGVFRALMHRCKGLPSLRANDVTVSVRNLEIELDPELSSHELADRVAAGKKIKKEIVEGKHSKRYWEPRDWSDGYSSPEDGEADAVESIWLPD